MIQQHEKSENMRILTISPYIPLSYRKVTEIIGETDRANYEAARLWYHMGREVIQYG